MTTPRPLPKIALDLCRKLRAPPRLVAHLTLVHEVSVEIVEGLRRQFPTLAIDADAVVFGAATHDIGKVQFPSELAKAGTEHEQAGANLLIRHGIDPNLARFARTHGAWSKEALPIDDLLVALADTVWKGKRNTDLESRVVRTIANQIGQERWEVFDTLDQLLEAVAAEGNDRLVWQRQFPV